MKSQLPLLLEQRVQDWKNVCHNQLNYVKRPTIIEQVVFTQTVHKAQLTKALKLP